MPVRTLIRFCPRPFDSFLPFPLILQKPVTKKHKFIDKRRAVKFNVVNRSQRDPLAADPNAPRGVLQTIREDGGAAYDGDHVHDLKREEQVKFGIYFDDDYDYLQHLREAGDVETAWEEVPDARGDRKDAEAKPKKKVRSLRSLCDVKVIISPFAPS